MGYNVEGAYLEAAPEVTAATVRAAIVDSWRGRGARVDDRDPLRLRRGDKRDLGRFGYAISPVRAGWIALAESERVDFDWGLIRDLAHRLGVRACWYNICDTTNDASIRFLNWPEHAGVRSRDVQDFVAESFPFPLLYFDDLVSYPVGELSSFTTVGFTFGDASGTQTTADVAWSHAQRGESGGFLAALRQIDAAGQRQVIQRMHCASAGDRQAMLALVQEESADFVDEAVPAVLIKAANSEDDELFEACLRVSSPVAGAAMLYRAVGHIYDNARAMQAIDALQAFWPERACSMALSCLQNGVAFDEAVLESWIERIRRHDGDDASTEHELMRLWVKLGMTGRALEHAESALSLGLPLKTLRYRDASGVPDPDHRAMTREPRYRELIKRHSPPSAGEERGVHAKFGPGKIVEERGDKVVVDFDEAGRKILLRRFVERRS